MNNSDERDYAEEEYNRREFLETCPECGESREGCECDIEDLWGDGDIPETDDEMYRELDKYVGKHRISA